MKQLGIFYGSSSGRTESVAMYIHENLGKTAGIHDVAETNLEEIMNYRNLILGIPTWGIGELQDDWNMVLPVMRTLDLTGKTVALFGLGDQESYPDTFGDAMGTLYDILEKTGCRIIGKCSWQGFNFRFSKALRGNDFVGLLIDEVNQEEQTESRIQQWLGRLDFR